MKLGDLVKAITPVAFRGASDIDITGIAYDSRQVRPGHLFVALPGTRLDGAAFVDDALRRGAAAIVTAPSESQRRDVASIQVANPRRTLAALASAFYQHPSRRLQIVGVTGTNGKTTVAFLTRDILAAAGRKPGLLGTVNYEIGERIIPASRTTPEAADIQAMLDQMLQAGCQSVAMEVSSHALVQQRVHQIAFDAGIFTNLTRDHLDYHHTMEDYFQAKRLFFEILPEGGKKTAAIVNGDDPYGRRLAALARPEMPIIPYGLAPEAAVRAVDLRLSEKGSEFRVQAPWGTAPVQLKLFGRFNVYNALAALAAGGSLGIDLALMAEVLGQRSYVPGRLEPVDNRRGFQVFVDYAHTDDALDNVLQTLRELTRGRLIVVFGCGGNRDKTKRPLMGAVAARRADFTVLTSDNPRKEEPLEIIAQIRRGFEDTTAPYEVIVDRAAAIRRAIALAAAGDVILIAGKGHENYQEFANTIVPFDDRKIARDLLA
jgi:UDP-N-acetylmuramoyl-L-alanyl-D-glutamate--2,6-diaminopimelate ligase